MIQDDFATYVLLHNLDSQNTPSKSQKTTRHIPVMILERNQEVSRHLQFKENQSECKSWEAPF